jgi:hypothetical protein
MRDPAEELLQACQSAQRQGLDFPTIWNAVLRKSRFVVGQPRQSLRNGEPSLEVNLTTGQRVVFASGEYSVA